MKASNPWPGPALLRAKLCIDLFMHSDLENLLTLQDVDKEIFRLREEIADLPRRVAVIEEKLAGTKARLEAAKAAIKADETARKKHEAAISDLQGKISKFRDQQLSVKTNEQYKALLHEIEFAQKEIQGNEDKILETMLDVDNKNSQVNAAEAELKAENAEIEKEKAVALQKTAEDEKQLGELAAKRNDLRSGVAAELLAHYERVAKARKTGISEVRDSKCLTCQVILRPQVYAEVRAGQKMVMCESCSRILYYRAPTVATAVEAPVKRRRPKADAEQAWFYRSSYGEHGEVLLVLINGADNSSRRVYDLHTGRLVIAKEVRPGSYTTAFADDLVDAVRLNGALKEEEMEEYGAELPMIALDPLHRDLAAAQREPHDVKEKEEVSS
jgi:uncharacterized protein